MTKPGNTVALVDDIAPPEKSLFDRVAEYLDANDWRYTATREKGYFSMDCRIAEASVRLVLSVTEREGLNRIMAFAVYPIFVPDNRRAPVLKFMNELNYDLVFGNFEMDPEDGQIRFRTSAESDSDIRDFMIERVLNGNLTAANRYFAVLMGTVFGSAESEGAKELANRPEGATLQ